MEMSRAHTRTPGNPIGRDRFLLCSMRNHGHARNGSGRRGRGVGSGS